jgi:hypothetical protein
MNISCNFSTSTADCDVPWIQSLDMGNGTTTPISTLWDPGDLFLTFFIVVFLAVFFSKFAYNFFFNPEA